MKNERGLFFIWVHSVAHTSGESRRNSLYGFIELLTLVMVRTLGKEENEMVGMTRIIRSLRWCMIVKDGFVFDWTSYKGKGCLALVVLWFAIGLVWWLVFPFFFLLKKKRCCRGLFWLPFFSHSLCIKFTLIYKRWKKNSKGFSHLLL